MAFQVHSQYIDSRSGFHVIELRDESGVRHVVQIALGEDKCPLCGNPHPKNNLGEIDPKSLVAEVIAGLDQSHDAVLAYAKKHGVKVK